MDNHNSCEFPVGNPPPEDIKKLLTKSKNIAIVGLSDNIERDSFKVAIYLKNKGYRVIPVNPAKENILGEKSYPDLKSIPEKIDIVDIFRKGESIPGIVDDAIEIGAECVWMQLGLSNNESARKAEKAGLTVVQSRCIKIEHSRLF